MALTANSRIFNEGRFGWQVPAENYQELKELLLRVSKSNPAELDLMGMRGKKYLENNLSYASLANELEKILTECTNKA
ncbi:MAG: hypothetical protein EOO01_24850 [Chitinophagaceae bacterium]|nr:MAG: hypothetical protein EOO01_24850 [Chitinophagaceae bacterium]